MCLSYCLGVCSNGGSDNPVRAYFTVMAVCLITYIPVMRVRFAIGFFSPVLWAVSETVGPDAASLPVVCQLVCPCGIEVV